MSHPTLAHTARTSLREALCFLLVAALLLCATAWARDLFDADEGRYGSVAAGMYRTGDWIVPRLNGMPFLDKPPLVYHVQVALYSVFGESNILARSPTLLAGVLWAFFLFLLARGWVSNRRVGWWAGLLALTSAAGSIGARVGPQMDMPLAAAVAGVLLAGWRGVMGGGRLAQVGLGVAVGCGLLIKGPLVVAVPGLVAIAWAVAGVDRRRLLGVIFSPVAWIVAFALATPLVHRHRAGATRLDPAFHRVRALRALQRRRPPGLPPVLVLRAHCARLHDAVDGLGVDRTGRPNRGAVATAAFPLRAQSMVASTVAAGLARSTAGGQGWQRRSCRPPGLVVVRGGVPALQPGLP